MKKLLIIVAAVAAMAACSKENASLQKEENNEVTPRKKMVLFAEVPEMTSGDGTRATADGSFSWSDGDEIAIPLKDGDYAVFEYNKEEDQFEYDPTGDEVFVAGTAYYPASVATGEYTTAFDNPSDARAGFKMVANYTLGASTLSFTHESALVGLSFTNVPSFATSVVVKKGGVNEATVRLSSPTSSLSLKVPVTPAASTSYSFALMTGSNTLREVSKTVTIEAGKCYGTPVIDIPKGIYIEPYDGWTKLYAYVYYSDNSDEGAWPGTEITAFTCIPYSTGKSDETAHVILNAGDENLAKPFTRIETDGFTANASKLVTLSTSEQGHTVLYFRDDTGQNNNWGNYNVYGWYYDGEKKTEFFGSWSGWGKSAFTWTEYTNYGQSNNYIGSYTFSWKRDFYLIINDGGSNQTNDIGLTSADNWFVVSNGCKGTANKESFPTVSVSVQ